VGSGAGAAVATAIAAPVVLGNTGLVIAADLTRTTTTTTTTTTAPKCQAPTVLAGMASPAESTYAIGASITITCTLPGLPVQFHPTGMRRNAVSSGSTFTCQSDGTWKPAVEVGEAVGANTFACAWCCLPIGPRYPGITLTTICRLYDNHVDEGNASFHPNHSKYTGAVYNFDYCTDQTKCLRPSDLGVQPNCPNNCDVTCPV